MVSEWDKAYIRRLGEYEREARDAALAEWRALPLSERLNRIAAMSFGKPPREDREPEDPSPLYERARRLGMYRE
jgi:hypothetical protein